MSARDDVLARIRAANAAAGHPPPPEVPRDYHRTGAHPAGSPELLELFRDRLVDYKATVLDAPADGIAEAVRTALADVAGAVVVPPGLPDGWWPAGIPATRRTDDALTPVELDSAAAVLTACAAACATTGTIALDGSADQGRRAITLVPDVHVCVVRAEQVVHTVPELIAALEPTRPITFVSGPSATSDIELERVEGVHGPRTLIVVLAA
ncbi:LutC/YkgG family protein [Pseudonocardia zijingensis]|uniref:LUD domain-containing protein n=1 Tax=Pseudonocardia zijingensis TaxID=153376 RepID=A0ABN1NZX2_9PSEU